MMTHQHGILEGVPTAARYLWFRLLPDSDPEQALAAVRAMEVDRTCVVGLGSALARHVGGDVPGLRTFPVLTGAAIAVPATPKALWCWLRGEDRGELLARSRAIAAALRPAGFELVKVTDAFKYDIGSATGRDLSGYEDGTENPDGDKAVHTAFLDGAGPGLDGSSFVAVQTWRHDLDRLESFTPRTRDHIIGRRRSDNEELDDAPESAHVKRTEQEDFEPEAFVLRRSMPWSDPGGEGLVFVAFGRSFDAFEAQLRRMVGLDDGITDALFRFTHPLDGAYFWCPPTRDGRLDLSALQR